LEKLHIMLIKKGLNKPLDMKHQDPELEEGILEKHILYNEYKNLFREGEMDGLEFMEDFHNHFALKVFGGRLDTQDSNREEFQTNKGKIQGLQEERITKNERNFLFIIEKNNFEKLDTWHPENCSGQFCWKIWYTWYCIVNFSKIIISHNAFEGVSLLVILCNSVTLALEDPTWGDSDTPAYMQIFDYVFLGLYTVEMTLKILGLGFLFAKGAY
jgi:hypothetical protein